MDALNSFSVKFFMVPVRTENQEQCIQSNQEGKYDKEYGHGRYRIIEGMF
jgi:hypothetical protein